MVEILRALLVDTAVRLSLIYSISVCYFSLTHTHTIDFRLIFFFALAVYSLSSSDHSRAEVFILHNIYRVLFAID